MKTAIPHNIIISRTDSIGDVMLTLPVAAVLKQYFPGMKIGFMGKAYTRPVIEACKWVDSFIDVTDFLNKENGSLVNGEKAEAILHVFPVANIASRAKQIQIPLRIGTTNRLYHWFTCNKLVRLSRKNSLLHEAQLNLKLLSAFGIENDFSLAQIQGLFGFEKLQSLSPDLEQLIEKDKYNLILHPKSQGNGREWGLEHYRQLAQSLDKAHYKVFISGTQHEKELMKVLLEQLGDSVTDITGRMDLSQFISFINHCDGLVASGTGPLHMAAALGKDAYGLFPPIRPVHPGRWAPIGPKAHVFVLDRFCEDCKGNKKPCTCMLSIKPVELKMAIEKMRNAHSPI